MKYFILILLIGLTFAQTQSRIVGTSTTTGKNTLIKTDSYGYLIPIEFWHQKVHEGKFFTVSKTFTSVAANDTAKLVLKTNSKSVHFEIFIVTEGKAYLKTFSNITYGDSGAVYTPFNRRSNSTEIATSQWFTGTKIKTFGTQRGDDLFGAGSPNRAGGQGSRPESILAPNSKILIALINKDSQSKDINIIVNFYEE
jgi:hypothetical protein